MSGEKAEKKGVLRFEEGLKQFLCWNKKDGVHHKKELAIDIYLDEEDIGYICMDGKITIGGTRLSDTPSKVMTVFVTLTPAQRKEIDRKADEFQRKCDVDNVTAECESVIAGAPTLFPMFTEKPIEEPVRFIDEDETVQIHKGEERVGVMWKNGLKRGKLVLCYPVQNTGLSEADKLAIVEKCKAIMAAPL